MDCGRENEKLGVAAEEESAANKKAKEVKSALSESE